MLSRTAIISALKNFADQWMVVKVGSNHWFSDGSAILMCEGPENHRCVHPDKLNCWREGIAQNLERAEKRAGYQLAAKGTLVGAFKGGGYFRQFTGHAGRGAVYLNERYVRAVDADQAWVAGAPKSPVVLTLAGKLMGFVMPVGARRGTSPMPQRPEVPFLEDEVLYHDCEAEE